MGKHRAASEGYIALISHSGVVANLQTYLKNDPIDSNPGRGIFRGGQKFLDQWIWDINAEEDYSTPTLARPDFLKRKIVGSVVEVITLHPENACGMIELEGKYREVATFSPYFDFQSLIGKGRNFSTQWDDVNKVFLATSESGETTMALISNGEWMPDEETRRVEYVNPWPPLEPIRGTKLFGRFSFFSPEKPVVVFAIGKTKEEAVELAKNALTNQSELKNLATKRVIDVLEKRSFYSQDEKFRVVAAWDHWLLENSRTINSKGRERIINRPPFPSFNDPGANGTVLPALELAGNKTGLPYTIAKSLNPELSMRDPEGFLIAIDGLFESYVYTNNSSYVDTLSSDNSRGLESLLDWALKNGTIQYLPNLTRWDIDVRNSGLPSDTLRLKLGLDDLLANTIGTIRAATDRKAAWYGDYTNLLSGKMRLSPISLPIHNIVLSPPENWSSDVAMVHKIASEMPACNLALIDRNLRGESRRNRQQLTEMALGLWVHLNGGLRVHASEEFSAVAFTAPLWRAWRHTRTLNNQSSSVALTSYMNPEYATWYKTPGGDKRKIPGGSYQDVEVVAERLKFLYENIMGITSKPGHAILNVAPNGSESFWQGKATRVNAGFGQKNVVVFMDPARGLYSFENFDGEVDIIINLEDIPVNGFMLSGQFKLAQGSAVKVIRKPDRLGRNTLTIDGVELKNVVRREL